MSNPICKWTNPPCTHVGHMRGLCGSHYRRLRESGIVVKPRPRGRPRHKFDYERAAQLRREGATVAEIAAEVGASVGAVERAVRIQGAYWPPVELPARSCVECGRAIRKRSRKLGRARGAGRYTRFCTACERRFDRDRADPSALLCRIARFVRDDRDLRTQMLRYAALNLLGDDRNEKARAS